MKRQITYVTKLKKNVKYEGLDEIDIPDDADSGIIKDETLFKQLKQNFGLKYFYGDSVNAIESQIWVVMIANLLLTILQRKIKRTWAFSNLATIVRLVLMNYINIFSFLENPEEDWLEIIEKPPQKITIPSLFD